ncbi:hypothetical protein CAPTEDRAFT_220698 [Capitella teleta]|uniref:BTB/POZ domain-containing protein 9 n=1 Tax=Capitella teleta TaxID=283909 RepID=R7UR78_CAPTE|nr:hypothetical protein CAPTEDRAFT_220698 [Capitella teleta]|eukprot:ELU08603.1 hypothetical protein CAPTEDRAFT_220698 [Capitella teleta]
MCDHHHLRPQTSSHASGDVEHVNFLSEDIGALFLQDNYSDITLVVEEKKFPVHKVILAARSEYFRALLFGGLCESKPGVHEITLKDTAASSFQHLLKYIYTGRMLLTSLQEESLLDVLGLADRFGFVELKNSISQYLEAMLSIRNVCLIYDMASVYSLSSLLQTCFEFMDQNAMDTLQSDSFMTLSASSMRAVLSRDSFCAPEIEIFKAVRRWAEQNPEVELSSVMCSVRLPLMSLGELLNIVRESSLVSADLILDSINIKTTHRDTELSYRGSLVPEENIATLRHGAQVIRGEMKSALLDGDFNNYDLDRGFSRHPIDDNNPQQGIVVQLGSASIINTIRLLLWDKDMRSYSYHIEVSMDEKDWVRVIDHTRFQCRSWQYLRFPQRVVKFVKITGTHNSVNRVFHLVCFECMFSKKTVELEGGIIVPRENVATIRHSACVVEGVSRCRNALINGDIQNYDWDSGYTCHQLGSGAIVVQLAQPYVLSSMRLLLWDCDGRSYSYYVEVSTDQQHWTMIADFTKKPCRSWQVFTFPSCAMTFIKIVGTHNTANEVFHCVHFECPAESSALSEFESRRSSEDPSPPTLRLLPPAGSNMALQGLNQAADAEDGYGGMLQDGERSASPTLSS